MKKEFEDHCKSYSLVYDFKLLGDNYLNKDTHQAYILFKTTVKATIRGVLASQLRPLL